MVIGQALTFIDAKNRLYLPAGLIRENFPGAGRFVLSYGLDKCLYLTEEKSWNKMHERFESLPLEHPRAADYRSFIRFISSNSAYRRLDGKGRILLPEEFIRFAELGKKVILAGAGNKLEIWSEDGHRRFERENAARFRKMAASIIL